MRGLIRWSAALIGVAVANAGSAGAQSMDQLYEAAKKEGALTLVGGGPAPPYEKFAAAFMQRYPGIAVTATGGPSNVHSAEIDKQLAANALKVDLAMLQTVQDFERWKQAGALLAYNPDGFDKIDAGWKDADGAYVGVQVSGLVYAYNTEKVAKEAVPRRAIDFLKPEFKGRIITTYPHVDDVSLYLYATIMDRVGADFLDKLKPNELSFVRGHLGVSRAVASGDKFVTFDAVARDVQEQAQVGKPIAIALPDSEPMPVWAQIAGIFKSAPHPNAAKLFVAWYLQPEQQRLVGHWPARSDVPPPQGLQPLSSYRLANSYRSFVLDEPRVKALRERALQFTGPVQGGGTYR
jgi:ABC-type Fe3+ transport system substrate-binding protein